MTSKYGPWRIAASVTYPDGDWNASREIPTFVIPESAGLSQPDTVVRHVMDVINPTGRDDCEWHVSMVNEQSWHATTYWCVTTFSVKGKGSLEQQRVRIGTVLTNKGRVRT